jgi:hypothetical protein
VFFFLFVIVREYLLSDFELVSRSALQLGYDEVLVASESFFDHHAETRPVYGVLLGQIDKFTVLVSFCFHVSLSLFGHYLAKFLLFLFS